MARLKIKDAPLLTNIVGTEKIPTGNRGDFTITPDLLVQHFINKIPFVTQAQLASVKAELESKINTVETTLSQSISALDDRVSIVETEMLGFTQDLTLHIADQNNPHKVTKQQVGLGSVDNTSDLNKPISNPTKDYVDAKVATANKGYNLDYFVVGKSYPINAEIMLTNGAVVKSLIDNNTTNPNSDMTNWSFPLSKDIHDRSGKTQQEINDLLLRETISTYIITPQTHSDISSILTSLPENTTVIIKNGNYTASGVQIEKSNFKIEMQDNATLTLTAGTNGVFLRFGKRGLTSDYDEDNLPQYNGTLDYWDELQYSPSSPTHPRYKNVGISGGVVILSNSNGAGSTTGIDFYRCDNPVLETNIKWLSQFAFGNAVRVHFCKDMRSQYLNIDDNASSTFTMLYYWSYGLRAGAWNIGAGVDTSMEFKHSVDGYVATLKCRGSGGSCRAMNIGYGSINNVFGRVEARNGSVRLKASEEFDLSRGVVIADLDIENTSSEGLIISHVSQLRIDKMRIRAKVPMYLSASPFYKFSSNRSIVPNQSTAEYVFDGNYRTSSVSNGLTKYFEKRSYPVLQDAVFGQSELLALTVSSSVLTSNIVGGVADMMNTSGKLRRFEDNQIPNNGYQELWRTSFKYEYTAPNCIENVDFGNMSLKMESSSSNVTTMAIFSMPLIKCRGVLQTFADRKSLQWIWMFDSDMTLETNRYLTVASGYVIEMDSMVRSTLRGKWLANGRVINFKGGSASYYTDGYVAHELTGEIIRQSTPLASPPLFTNYASAMNTWNHVSLSGLKIYADDGSSTLGDASIIRHNGSIPTGLSIAQGEGYVSDQGCFIDHKNTFRRLFTASLADTAPTLTPNRVGELCLNTTTNTWWIANGVTSWSKL